MKCDKCGVTDNGTGDWAHVCGPVKVKKSGMNEQIQELAEQASHQSPDGYAVTIPYSKDFAKKFAELIVKECANVGERYADGNYEVYNQIMAHFGLEEE